MFKHGFKNIVGIDEAGRGSLAGPVVSASVILEKKLLVGNPFKFNDSKKLPFKSRKKMFNQIINSKSIYSIGVSNNNEVDNEGIVKATKNSMKKSLNSINYDYALIDSIDLIFILGVKSLIHPQFLSFSIIITKKTNFDFHLDNHIFFLQFLCVQ